MSAFREEEARVKESFSPGFQQELLLPFKALFILESQEESE